MDRYIMAIEWGSTSLKMIMALHTKHGFNIEDVQSIPYKSIKEGVEWTDIEALGPLLAGAISRFRKSADGRLESILGVPGYYTGIAENSCKIDIAGSVVGQEHIYSAIDRCSQYNLPDDWSIMQVLPRLYRLDGQYTNKEPIGIRGHELDLNSSLICVNQTFVTQLTDILVQHGIYIDYIRPTLLSSGSVFLTEAQRFSGSILIDIGEKSTDIIVYRDRVPIFSEWFPVGGHNITNDISIGLDLPYEEAKRLKKRCVVGEIPLDSSLEYVKQIAEMRIEEIFQLIKDSIASSNTVDMEGCSAVVLGDGIAHIRGVRSFASNILGCDVKVDKTSDAGLYALINDHVSKSMSYQEVEDKSNIQIIKDKIINWVLELFNK
ncbi:MAG: pilus assembly protein PilM [Clostridiales bacterium]|nr:pilus assembly protein PilM [Clostridiales bacterium]